MLSQGLLIPEINPTDLNQYGPFMMWSAAQGCYQDTAGTTPCTVETPAALVLDKGRCRGRLLPVYLPLRGLT